MMIRNPSSGRPRKAFDCREGQPGLQARIMVEMNTSRTYRVYFDGQCGSCHQWMARLKRLDRHGRVEDVAFSPECLPPGVTLEECCHAMHVELPSGAVRSGWRAAAALARLSPWTWLIGAVGIIPPFVWVGDWLYARAAASRHSCQLKPANQEEKAAS